jgi:hypothetical protein
MMSAAGIFKLAATSEIGSLLAACAISMSGGILLMVSIRWLDILDFWAFYGGAGDTM